MTRTILPKKTASENPFASNDAVQEQLIADPAVQQFPQNNFGQSNFNAYPSYGPTQVNTNNINQTYNSQPILTAPADTNAASDAEILVKNNKQSEDWINKKWRPAMGWMYMAVCIFDFIVFPVLWAVIQFWETQAANDAFRQWQPLTLQGAGLFHMAMGAVLGIAAYGRTKEKLERLQ
jgi:hypothetical protein